MRSVAGKASVSAMQRSDMYCAVHGPMPGMASSALRNASGSCASERERAPSATRRLTARIAARRARVVFTAARSASAAAWFFKLYGTPFFRVETYFQLPGFSLNVAPECSGIHSSLALFITSLVASYLFLRSPWRRTLLCLAVLPLAILRNGLRVFVIGELCVHVGPEMIDSYIHRHGGPIFFVLSLVPFFLLLLLLIRSERRRSQPSPSTPESS